MTIITMVASMSHHRFDHSKRSMLRRRPQLVSCISPCPMERIIRHGPFHKSVSLCQFLKFLEEHVEMLLQERIPERMSDQIVDVSVDQISVDEVVKWSPHEQGQQHTVELHANVPALRSY